MSHDATFTPHTGNVVSTAQSPISSICRSFETRTPEVTIQLSKSLVIPHLEDYCQLWNPKLNSEIKNLEILQNNFTRRIAGANKLDYWERLQKFRCVPWKEDGTEDSLEKLSEVGAKNHYRMHSKHFETRNG